MPESKEFKRSLGLWDATGVVAGSMIGSGIFLVSVYMAQDLGSPGYLLLVWLITGLITLAASLSYGELAGMMPEAGGQYIYIQRAFGKLPAFLYGWTVFSVIQTGVIAAVAVAFANYTSVFFPKLNETLISIGSYHLTGVKVLALGSVVALTWINSRGIEGGKWVIRIFTSAKLLALFLLIVLGIVVGSKLDFWAMNWSDGWTPVRTFKNETGSWISEPLSGALLFGVMGSTIINSLFSSDAWNNVTFIASEIKDPQRNIPRSLFLGTFIVTVLYLLANIAYLFLLPLKGDPSATSTEGLGIMFAANDRVGAAAAGMIFGDSALYIMAALIMVSTFGCNNGIILSGARLYYAMAKDKLFFSAAERLNDQQVPATALWVQCVWACVLCLSGQYGTLLTYSTFASLIFYAVTVYGIFVLRKKEPLTARPYRAFGYPVLPAIYIILTLLICVDLLIFKTLDCGMGLGIILIGLPIYFIRTRR